MLQEVPHALDRAAGVAKHEQLRFGKALAQFGSPLDGFAQLGVSSVERLDGGFLGAAANGLDLAYGLRQDGFAGELISAQEIAGVGKAFLLVIDGLTNSRGD